MRIGYFDCFAGAAGDMILGALFDAGLDEAAFTGEISRLRIEGLKIEVGETSRKSIKARTFGFRHSSDASAGTYKDIVKLLKGSGLDPRVTERALEAFDLIAGAESGIHGVSKHDVHFHEIGSVDTVVDVAGSFIGLDLLGIEEVVCSPLSLGTGSVKCAHGVLPVPAPATLRILEGVPVRGTGVERELTTPTGAAILRTAAARFGPMPEMRVEKSGYGAGTGDLEEMANVIRFVVGEAPASPAAGSYERDAVLQIEANIDDMNPQVVAHLYDGLFAAGALDVWIANVVMKKGRPGFLLGILCPRDCLDEVSGRVFAETTTAGVRMHEVGRLKLRRTFVEAETRYGKVRVKVFSHPGGERRVPEYEDCLHLAESLGVPVQDVIEEARNAAAKSERRAS